MTCMRAHVSCTQQLRSHVVIRMNYLYGNTMLTKILVYLGLIKATVSLPLCILLGIMRSPLDEDERFQTEFKTIVTQA